MLPDNRDYVIFSSWIAPLATGQVQPSPGHGSIEGHILQAVSYTLDVRFNLLDSLDSQTTTGVPADELLARFRWGFPLCGGNPLHWVLGWVDFKLNEVGIFDSIPEIESKTWAEPVSTQQSRLVNH